MFLAAYYKKLKSVIPVFTSLMLPIIIGKVVI